MVQIKDLHPLLESALEGLRIRVWVFWFFFMSETDKV